MSCFGGLFVFDRLVTDLQLKSRLANCFGGERVVPMVGYHTVTLWLIMHLLLGFRNLRDCILYANDPLAQRFLGLSDLPEVSTLSRSLKHVDERSVEQVSKLLTELTVERLVTEQPARLTLDFDGSVISTSRHAEGSAVGFNKKKKGARSYYPLFCTIAQTGQFLDLHHRAGNVHDSNGSIDFVQRCFDQVKSALPRVVLEARMDSAFFNEEMITSFDADGVELSISVPFERFPELKALIEQRKRWRRLDERWSYFECEWKPACWDCGFRFIFVRQKKKKQTKGPLQLHLFEPSSYEYDYKVIVTNKTISAKKVLNFHNGRGAQEGIFGDAKNDCKLEYVPVKGLQGNKLYCLAAMYAHNLGRELQMQTKKRSRGTNEKRSPLWTFQTLRSLRQRIIQRAGRLVRPQGRLTLVLGADGAIRDEIETYIASTG